MHLLQSIGVKSSGVLFDEERVNESNKEKLFKQLEEQGGKLLAKHLSKDIYLFKSEHSYTIAHVSNEPSHDIPASLGAVIENLEDALESIHDNGLDIFDGGSVGELSLHLPAFRDTQGRIIYLIEKNQAHDFYAADFKAVEE